MSRLKTVLGGEIPLIIWSYGIGIILTPTWGWPEALINLPREIWGGVFIATAVLGYASLYFSLTKLWRAFLLVDVFLFSVSAICSWGEWDRFFLYLCLCYCCIARFLEMNSSGIPKIMEVSQRGVRKAR